MRYNEITYRIDSLTIKTTTFDFNNFSVRLCIYAKDCLHRNQQYINSTTSYE